MDKLQDQVQLALLQLIQIDVLIEQAVAAGNTDLSQRTEEQAASLEQTASSMDQINRAFQRIDKVIDGASFNPGKFDNLGSGLSAEQLYVNQKVTDLVSKAEMEQSDYREDRHLNVFFGPMKEYLGLRAGILWFNTLVLIASTLFLFFVLYLILRSQIRVRNS